MTDQNLWESFKAEGTDALGRIKRLIEQGNVRRVIIEHEGKKIAEFPLTIGVVGILVAPVVGAIAAVLALAKECTIHVEVQPEKTSAAAPASEPATHEPVDVQC